MRQPCGGARLTHDAHLHLARLMFGIARALERDAALQPRIVAEEHFAHAAGASGFFAFSAGYTHAHMTNLAAPSSITTRLTTNQIRGFWAAWGGWALDGMDSFIYSLVLVPALTELLPHSNIAVTPGNVGFYGSVLFALFLIGWGLSMIWGPIADRFGRVRTLTLTILCYSLFTLLCGLVTNIWQLAVLRLLAGVGIGGDGAVGGPVTAHQQPETPPQTRATPPTPRHSRHASLPPL